MTTKLKLKRINRDPPSGWIYSVNGYTFKTGDYWKLIRQTKNYYRVNKWDIPEDLEGDIQHYICERNPEGICKGEGKKRFFPNTRQIMNGTKVLIEKLRQGRAALVTQEEADRRAKICVACPMNVQIGGCFGCSTVYQMVKKSFDRTTRYDHYLRVCSICGCLNTAQVHIKAEILKSASKGVNAEDYPEEKCWKREILEDG